MFARQTNRKNKKRFLRLRIPLLSTSIGRFRNVGLFRAEGPGRLAGNEKGGRETM